MVVVVVLVWAYISHGSRWSSRESTNTCVKTLCKNHSSVIQKPDVEQLKSESLERICFKRKGFEVTLGTKKATKLQNWDWVLRHSGWWCSDQVQSIMDALLQQYNGIIDALLQQRSKYNGCSLWRRPHTTVALRIFPPPISLGGSASKYFKKVYCWIVIAVSKNVFTYYCSGRSPFKCVFSFHVPQCCLRHLVNIAVLKLSSSSRQCETGRLVAGWQTGRVVDWQGGRVAVLILIHSPSSSSLSSVRLADWWQVCCLLAFYA